MKNDFSDLETNISLMLKGIQWVKPVVRLHEELVSVSEIINQVSQLTKANDALRIDRDALQTEIDMLETHLDQGRFERKEQTETAEKNKQTVAAEVEIQRKESRRIVHDMEQDAKAAVAKATAKANVIENDCNRTQNIASLQHAEWRKQADREIADATQRLETLQHAATSIQDKIAQLTS